VSYDDIKEMTLFTMFAGHETTGTTMSHVLRFLGQHPGVRAKLRAEQVRFFSWLLWLVLFG
jgi:cytochrome P450